MNLSGQDASDERIVFNRGDQEGKRCIRITLRRGDIFHNQVEQRRNRVARILFQIAHSPSFAAGSEQNREIQLFIRRVQSGEQIENFVVDFHRAGIRTVNLIDDDNGFQADFQSLPDDEFCLGKRAFRRVNQNNGAVHHVQNTFDFAAEIGVSRRVNNIETGTLPFDRRTFCQNCYPSFAFQIIGVHGAFGDNLIVAERAALTKHGIDQSSFAVVDVGNNGNVSSLHVFSFLKTCRVMGLTAHALPLCTLRRFF